MRLHKTLIAASFAVAGFSLLGCAQTPPAAPVAAPPPAAAAAPSYPPSVNQMIAATKKQIKTIDMQQFKAGFDRKDLGLIVDVRNENEFEDGYVPGAVNVPRGLIEFRIWKLVGFPDATNMAAKMTLYCATGGRCALATKTLQDMGFTNVTSVDMRFADWVKAGYPVAKPAN
jgi:rhodanese-related sulfurtransferase